MMRRDDSVERCEKYEATIGGLDGSHALWEAEDGDPHDRKKDWSYKLKDWGYNMMVIADFTSN